MKPKTNKQRKERNIDKDTVVAYHEFIQGRIQGQLNGIAIGPGYTLCKIAAGFFIFGVMCLITGILLLALRHRHVYLVDWNEQFLGPFLIVVFLFCCTISTYILMLAKKRTNEYRRNLAFRPIGDYGVAVVHKSKLNYDDQKKTELKSGTTPHNVRHPGRPGVNDRGNRGDYSKSRGYDSRGYKDDPDRRTYDNEKRRDRDRDSDRDRDHRDGRDRDRDHHDGRSRSDRPRDNRPPRRDGDRRPPRPEGERSRDDRDRSRRPPGDPGRPRPPRGPDDDRRRAEGRRKYEEDKRRRYEEDKRRAELRKQAVTNAENYDRMERSASQERGIDVDPSAEEGTRTYQIQTTVKLSREIQEADESEL